jgi:gas vesicle protein
MGQDTGQIREEIEETRTRMGDTVEALGYKADVPSRVSDKVGNVRAKITGSTPDGAQMKDGAKLAVGVAQQNPIGLALGSVAVGFVAGMLIPSTRVEDEKIGPMADQMKERAKETGQEALDRGKHVAQEAAQSAAETAKESGQQQAEDLRGSAQEKVDQTRQEAT